MKGERNREVLFSNLRTSAIETNFMALGLTSVAEQHPIGCKDIKIIHSQCRCRYFFCDPVRLLITEEPYIRPNIVTITPASCMKVSLSP